MARLSRAGAGGRLTEAGGAGETCSNASTHAVLVLQLEIRFGSKGVVYLTIRSYTEVYDKLFCLYNTEDC